MVKKNDNIAAIVEIKRAQFTERRYKLGIFLSICFALVLSIALNVILYTYIPYTGVVVENQYGQIRNLPTLDEPIFEDADVLLWASEALQKAYYISHLDITSHKQSIRRIATEKAANQIISGLEDAGYLTKILEEKRILSLQLLEAPVLLSKGVNKTGRFVWRIQARVRMKFNATGDSRTDLGQALTLRASIGREDLVRSDDQLTIGNIVIGTTND